jgi:hypothetical protein
MCERLSGSTVMHLGMHHGSSCRCIIGHTWQSSRGRGFKALLSWGRHGTAGQYHVSWWMR